MTPSTIEKLDKLPDSALTNLSEPATSQPSQSEETISQPYKSPISLVEDNDIMSAGQSAKTNIFNTGGDSATGAKPFSAATGGATVTQPMKLGNSLSGKFAVDMMDSLLPSLAVLLVGWIGYKMKKVDLQLSADEKKVIIPPMQDYLNSININFNSPLGNLCFALLTVYGSKVVDALPNVEKVNKKKVEAVKTVTKTKEPSQELTYEEEIAAIMKTRKKGRTDAVKWYNSNKKQKQAA